MDESLENFILYLSGDERDLVSPNVLPVDQGGASEWEDSRVRF